MGVGRHRIHLDAHLLKRRVDVGEIFEFGRTDEREIGGVEEENRPLALHVSIGDVDEFAILERGDRKSTRSELQSLMRISYAVFCLTKKNTTHTQHTCRK